MGKPKSMHVVVALKMAGIAGQEKLNGIFEYLSEGRRWTLAIFRTLHEFTAQTVRRELARGTAGFIVGLPGADAAIAEIAKSDRPVVLLDVGPGSLARRRGGIVLVRSDAEAVGREAADELLKQGVYKSYGFAGRLKDGDWSRDRCRAFRATLKEAGFVTHLLADSTQLATDDDRGALVRWLKSLPKPCGILASCDDLAYEILDACHDEGIRVPQEIGLLGVDNDPQLCENTHPTLSSVQPDFKREGYLAAKLIDDANAFGRFRVPANARSVYLVGTCGVVHRDSTYPVSTSGKLVQSALAFIERHATHKLSVDNVAAHLRISRSLLDLRFRQLQRESVHTAILRVRLAEVQRRLATTSDTIERISSDCGWSSPNALKNTFRREFGCSMRAWRNGNR